MAKNQNNTRARLATRYYDEVRPRLQQALQLGNIMEVPQIVKVVLNVGIKRSSGDSRTLQLVDQTVGAIAGQQPVRRKARKSIASFKIREGMDVGCSVTLRRNAMYTFLDKLMSLSLPKVRDFQGVSPKFDGRGNYNLGIREWGIFPEADDLSIDTSFGMNITIHTTARSDEHAYELLKQLGMPFRKKA